MREKYWNFEEGASYGKLGLNPFEVYSFWCNASWQRLVGESDSEEETPASLLHRSAIAHMLALVISETPENKPYLDGLTYKQIPQLLLPRILSKNKPRGNLPTETLAIYYEVQTEKSVQTASIAVGQIAEAWANFGWIGILVIGGVIGLVLSLPSHLVAGCSVNQVGFLISAVFLSISYNLELTLGPWLITLFDALLVACIGLYLISRPVDTERPALKRAQARGSGFPGNQRGVAGR
jgi:hypothetical protein